MYCITNNLSQKVEGIYPDKETAIKKAVEMEIALFREIQPTYETDLNINLEDSPNDEILSMSIYEVKECIK